MIDREEEVNGMVVMLTFSSSYFQTFTIADEQKGKKDII